MPRETLEQRCRRIMLVVGWDMPFFLMPAANVRYVETLEIETMAVTLSGAVEINPEFARAQTDQQLAFCICHELMHLLMLHLDRGASFADKPRIAKAQDMAINQALREMTRATRSVLQQPTGVLFPPYGSEHKNSEQLYEDLPPTPPEEQGNASKVATVGAGCTVRDDSASNASASPQALARKWQEVSAQAARMAAGTAAGDVLARRVATPPSKVKWEQLLRSAASHALSRHGRDEQTFTRRARRAPARVILPGWWARRAQMAVVIDSSGSMDDHMLARAVSEAVKVGQVSGMAVYLVVHDSKVQFSGWLQASPDVVWRRMKGRGGTDFAPAYRAVEGAPRGHFDAVVHLTDGECFNQWPAPPKNGRRFIAALVGSRGGERPRPARATTVKVSL